MLNNSLFEFSDNSVQTASTIKIPITNNLSEEWEVIFEEEYDKHLKKTNKILTDKSLLKKRALESVRRQLGSASVTKDFHLSSSDLFLNSIKNPVKNGKIRLQRELMLSEEFPVEDLIEVINRNILTMMRTAAFCTVIGG